MGKKAGDELTRLLDTFCGGGLRVGHVGVSLEREYPALNPAPVPTEAPMEAPTAVPTALPSNLPTSLPTALALACPLEEAHARTYAGARTHSDAPADVYALGPAHAAAGA